MFFQAKVWGDGKLQDIQIDASSSHAALELLRHHGRVIGKIKEVRADGKFVNSAIFLRFAEDLSILINAGLSLIESLDLLASKATKGSALLVAGIRRRVSEGTAFSQALEQVHGPQLLVALVKASEQTGSITIALERFVKHQKRSLELKHKISSAIGYPLLLTVTGLLVIGFLLFYVVPRFSLIFEDIGQERSWTVHLILCWSNLIAEQRIFVMGIFFAAVGFPVFLLLNRNIRNRLQASLRRLPHIGNTISNYQVANIFRTLSMLCEGGIPLHRGLQITAEATRDHTLQKKLRQIIEQVAEGRALSNAFGEASLGDDVALSLLSVSERSGSLAASFGRIAEIYDINVTNWVERFMRLFEPILMLMIGLAVGVIVVLMYMPIFELAGSLQ